MYAYASCASGGRNWLAYFIYFHCRKVLEPNVERASGTWETQFIFCKTIIDWALKKNRASVSMIYVTSGFTAHVELVVATT